VKLAGQTVLLTGATGGLGQAIAHALAARGASLLLSGRRAETLDALAEQTSGRALVADLGDRADLDRLIAELAQERVDVLVANAGLPASGLVTEFSAEELDRALDVNLRAAMLLAQALLEPMLSRGAGQLVFMSSLSGKVAVHRTSIYSATKFGLRGFAQGLREDLRGSGVGVSTIFPGPIRDAGMFAGTEVRLPPGAGSRSPQDVAAAVVRAIEHDRAEIDVASLPMRLGTSVGVAAPRAIAALNRRLGSEEIASLVAERQRGKR